MQLATHHRFALVFALGLSGIALFDAVTHGLTGHWSAFSDESDIVWMRLVSSAVHGLAYLGGLWVLHSERRRLHVNRPASVFGWLLFAAFVPLAVGFLTVMPLHQLGAVDGLVDVLSPVIGISFALQFLAGAGLGLSLWRHPATGPGSRVLLAILPAIGVTALIAVLAGDWAHPAYVETVTIVGTALLGAAAPARRPVPPAVPARA